MTLAGRLMMDWRSFFSASVSWKAGCVYVCFVSHVKYNTTAGVHLFQEHPTDYHHRERDTCRYRTREEVWMLLPPASRPECVLTSFSESSIWISQHPSDHRAHSGSYTPSYWHVRIRDTCVRRVRYFSHHRLYDSYIAIKTTDQRSTVIKAPKSVDGKAVSAGIPQNYCDESC